MAKMKSSPCKFDTSVEALKSLKASGVPKAVILAIFNPLLLRKRLDQGCGAPVVDADSETQAQSARDSNPLHQNRECSLLIANRGRSWALPLATVMDSLVRPLVGQGHKQQRS